MADRFVLPRAEVQDSSGGVEAGAKLEFFESGTSTNLDTFSDDALSSANANPVGADSAGRFGAIFLKDQDYKVTLSTSADVQIWSADPVRGGVDNLADDTIRSSLSTTGSANAYTLTVNRTFSAYTNGQEFAAKANFQNTGAATLNVTPAGGSALGAKTIKKNHDQDLTSGDIENGQWCVFKYDGTNMQLLSPLAIAATYVDPITTRGDIIRGDVSGNVERLALGAADTFVSSDGTDVAYVAAATQAEQEAGSVTNKPVTPGRQHFHQSAAKGWVKFSNAAVVSVSYNTSSVTDNALGDFTVNWNTDFSTIHYSVVGKVLVNGTFNRDLTIRAQAAGTTQVITQASNADAPTENDITDVYVVAFGDH